MYITGVMVIFGAIIAVLMVIVNIGKVKDATELAFYHLCLEALIEVEKENFPCGTDILFEKGLKEFIIGDEKSYIMYVTEKIHKSHKI
ncbi:MAG: hypothetical protein F8N39_13635 [Clostridiaceae bacterium]|nr:hypothetical protein [Clostridiaceae bacterium]